VKNILRSFNVSSFDAYPLHGENVFGIETKNGDYILKRIVKNDYSYVRLLYEYRLSNFLHTEGIPVARPLKTCDGGNYLECKNFYYVLMPKLPNTRPDYFSIQSAKIYESVGSGIARLNASMARYPNTIRDWWHICVYYDFYRDVFPKIKNYVSAAEYNQLSLFFSSSRAEIKMIFGSYPLQLLHGDCHPKNICVSNNEVTGFIDCDLLPIGPRLYDLCYFLIHILMFYPDSMYDDAKTKIFLSLCPHSLAGYDSVACLTAYEKKAFFYLLLYIPLQYFTHKSEKNIDAYADYQAFWWVLKNRDNLTGIKI